MLTHGVTEEHLASFRALYREARGIYLNADGEANHAPHDPVVRLDDRGDNGGVTWRLTSGINSAEDTLLECPLAGFDDAFECVYGTDYTPTLEDMRAFTETLYG